LKFLTYSSFVSLYCKIGAIRHQILRLKRTKFDLSWGLPSPRWELTALPRPLSYWKGGKEGEKKKGRDREIEGEWNGGRATPSNWRVWIRQWRRGGRERAKWIARVGASRHFFFYFKHCTVLHCRTGELT